MDPRDYVSVSAVRLNLSEIAAMVADPCAGATSTFSGTTRDNHYGERIARGRVCSSLLCCALWMLYPHVRLRATIIPDIRFASTTTVVQY